MSNTKQYGFFGHVSLIVGAKQIPIVHGLGEASFWTRNQKNNLWSEKNRWLAHVESVNLKFPWCKVIHVSDRETDTYEFLSNLKSKDCHFVVRACHLDRKVNSDVAQNLAEEIQSISYKFSREIKVSKRAPSGLKSRDKIHPAREDRTTMVKIGAKQVTLKRSQHLPQSAVLPDETSLNMVVIREVSDFGDTSPIEWILFTSEPIGTDEEIERVVELYRKRWLIEEFFKALKTGCSAEKRLLNSLEAWLNAIVLMIPIASTIMNLRNLQTMKRVDADKILNEGKWNILSMLASKSSRPLETLKEAMFEIARLGGYIRTSKPPGWLTLSRGFKKLIDYEVGWSLERDLLNVTSDVGNN